MKLAIISDIHFPNEITRMTFLNSECGYNKSFYTTLEDELKSLSSEDIDVFIVCGDFCWDYYYFQPFPDWDFQLPFLKIQEFRSLIDASIPIVFIEGNHDAWFNKYIFTKEGKAYFNAEEFQKILVDRYGLKSSLLRGIIENLQIKGENDVKIGDNIHFLRNDGLIVDDTFIYGFPFYKKQELQIKFSAFKEKLVQDFFNCLELKANSIDEDKLPIKTILCHHVHPPALKFVQAFRNPMCDIKAFYWGHYHNVSQDFINKLKNHGPYRCVMPEKNNLKLQIYEI